MERIQNFFIARRERKEHTVFFTVRRERKESIVFLIAFRERKKRRALLLHAKNTTNVAY